MKSYKIIGQGLAGTILSMRMIERGIPHTLHDSPSLSSSSRVAAGVVNPIVLKRLKLVHEAHFFYQGLLDFYRSWEKRLKVSFFHEAPIHHIFHTIGQQNEWMEKSENPAFSHFLGSIGRKCPSNLHAPAGIGKTTNTYWLDTNILLNAYRQYLQAKDSYNEEVIAYSPNANYIWCTGHLMRQHLPDTIFTPTRGELLIIHSEELKAENILHAGVFILPLGDNRYKVGATYAWNNLSDTPTAEGREYLENELRKMFTGSYKVLDHLAGVRPNIKDRKPVIGKLEEGYLFNGMGSRGVLLAPQMANLLLDFIEYNTPIPPQYDIQRFT